MIAILLFFTTMNDIITPLWTCSTFVCATIKTLHFYHHIAEAMALTDRLDTFNLQNNWECALMYKCNRGLKNFAVMCTVVTVCALNLYNLMMILINVEATLAFPAWLPFLDWINKTRDFWIAALFTCVSIHYNSLLLLPIEFLMTFLMFVISLEIEVIGKRLAAIGIHAKGTRENLQASTEMLIECIQLHRDSLEFKDSLSQLYSLSWTIQLFCSTLVTSAIVTKVIDLIYFMI